MPSTYADFFLQYSNGPMIHQWLTLGTCFLRYKINVLSHVWKCYTLASITLANGRWSNIKTLIYDKAQSNHNGLVGILTNEVWAVVTTDSHNRLGLPLIDALSLASGEWLIKKIVWWFFPIYLWSLHYIVIRRHSWDITYYFSKALKLLRNSQTSKTYFSFNFIYVYSYTSNILDRESK